MAPTLGFADVLLSGLASDGGLYVPESWPSLPADDVLARASTYAGTAAAVIRPFVGDDIDAADLDALCHRAYASFRHAAVVPLVQIDHRQWLAELFHGPTLAFKDVALQLVGLLFDHVLASATSASPSSAPRAVTPARRPSRRCATASGSTSWCSTPTVGRATCSAGR